MSKALIVYWSGTGNTEAMANEIKAGLEEKGSEVVLTDVTGAAGISLDGFDHLLFGCPSMGAEVLEEGDFEPYFTAAEKLLSGKKTALFGSYGWGDGEWMRNWAERTKAAGAVLFDDGLIVNEAPEGDACREYGRKIAEF